MINFSNNITGIVKLGLVKKSIFFESMLKLYILRHGKAVKPKENLRDFDRKLNKKGTAQVNQVGYILQNDATVIDQIIASGAQRTQETAEIMNYHLELNDIMFDDDLYLTTRENIQAILTRHADSKNVLLVGHNFGLTHFVNYLTGDNLMLSTAMMVEISFTFDDWNMLSSETGSIERIIEPRVHSF